MPDITQRAESRSVSNATEPATAPRLNNALHTAVIQRKLVQRRARQHSPSAATGASVQRKKETAAEAALRFNQQRRLPPAAWAQVARVLHAPGEALDDALVQALSDWQAKKGLDVSGRADDITFQWLSQEPGGAGLETHVKQETTLYMGMNPESSGVESTTLRNQTGAAGLVNASGDQRHQDQAHVGNQWLPLTSDAGLKQALASLPNLPPAKAVALTTFLQQAADKTRDEMFNMVRHLWSVETGRALLKRLVLSGHSAGTSLWGGHGGEFGSMNYQQIFKLMGLFPTAASQVEDLAFSACFSGTAAGKLDAYRAVFPNVKTIWAYADFSPSAATGSLRHLSKWEKGTKGHGDQGVNQARKEVATGHGDKDKNVAIWSASDGYQTDVAGAQLGTADLLANVRAREAAFTTAMGTGTIDMAALNDLYGNLQQLVNAHAADLGADLARYQTMLLQTLYLRNWGSITEELAARHGEVLQAGYEEAGLPPPRFPGMTRAAALAEVGKLRSGAKGAKAQQALRVLEQVVRDLLPAHIRYGGGGN